MAYNHCWQHEVNLRNHESNLADIGMDRTPALKAQDLDFVVCTTSEEKKSCKAFIVKHEWLGYVSRFVKYIFYASWKGHIAAVCCIRNPYATEKKLIGAENSHLICLLSRGASISWAPTNTASWLISRSQRWIVNNTDLRCFIAYSDKDANEVGIIYQSLNWTYIGDDFGTSDYYILQNGRKVSGRTLREPRAMKTYAISAGASREQSSSWFPDKSPPRWDLMDEQWKKRIVEEKRKVIRSLEKSKSRGKHKYVYILGRDRGETKSLRTLLSYKSNKAYPRRTTPGG